MSRKRVVPVEDEEVQEEGAETAKVDDNSEAASGDFQLEAVDEEQAKERATIGAMSNNVSMAFDMLKSAMDFMMTLPVPVQERLYHAHGRQALESLELLSKHFRNHAPASV